MAQTDRISSLNGCSSTFCPQFVEVREDGKLALTRGPYKMINRDDEGHLTEHWGTFNSVWLLGGDGQWRVVFDAGDGPGDAPAAEVLRDL